MNSLSEISFDPAKAISASSSSARVMSSVDQHRLDIASKERNSVLPWKGQFSPQLVEFLLSRHVNRQSLTLDPFCGSGTVLHEAARIGASAIGYDINPAAISLAKFPEICAAGLVERAHMLDDLMRLHSRLLIEATTSEGLISATKAADVLNTVEGFGHNRTLAVSFLLLAFGDSPETTIRKLQRSLATIREAVFDLPQSEAIIDAKVGDARYLPLPDMSVDYVVTSPPYINVFNYHQNYRPITEALGFVPLSAARSEIGANRKFRQNRFMTVVQYCMDMGLAFMELSRVLKEGRPLTIVLGRESNVRSVAFKNGELIAALVLEGMKHKLIDWNERKFLNRYGAVIFEDVMTILPERISERDGVELGRSVGRQALLNSLEYCPSDRRDEIVSAISLADTIEVSPRTKEL